MSPMWRKSRRIRRMREALLFLTRVIMIKEGLAVDSREWCVFNFCMVLASMYLSMMCSAWYDGDIKERTTQVFNFSSPTSFWVYNSSIWIAFVVFLYILVAPMVNTSRTYS